MKALLGIALLALPAILYSQADHAAPVPPMGWNSWDSYGLTVTEQEFLENANWMAGHMKSLGWEYAVVDEGWYLQNPEAKPSAFQFKLDTESRYVPSESRFPSAANGAGFAPLSAKVHAAGLKFGIHIIRGIPKPAVAQHMKIAGSAFTASDAADTSDTCPWNADNYGVKNNEAGQAYYDSLMQLYASWGIDYIKVDCIASHPYKADEIRMVSQAIHKTGRPMVLSLSPGPAPIEKVSELSKWADMWRISDDMWDIWKSQSTANFPQDLTRQFQKTAEWAEHVGDGRWPDADMLPLGHLGPRPGNGKERESALTHDEQKTLMTLWCIFRSPLIMGGNLTKLDEWTSGLLTNAEVIAVDQKSTGGKQAIAGNNSVVWKAEGGKSVYYVAVFNQGEDTRKLSWTWHRVGIPEGQYNVRDLWLRKDLGSAQQLSVEVPKHGAVLLKVSQ